MKIDFPAFIASVDQSIRNGQAKSARAELRKLREVKAPRSAAAELAWLAWRANLPELGIRLLHPIVRPEGKVPLIASVSEKAEYAHCLIRIGAVEEASIILNSLEGSHHPRIYLYQASAFISQWDYASALKPLRKYVRAKGVTPYERLVGKVNLAATFLFLRDFTRSTPLMRELLYESSLHRYAFMYGACLELAAQNFALQKKWTEFDKCLEKAAQQFQDTDSLESFFLKKWEAIIKVLKAKSPSRHIAGLERIRKEAFELSHWETVRQCDEYRAKATKDDALMLKLYFGTPYESYRERLLKEYKRKLSLPSEYVWQLNGKASGSRILPILIGEKLRSGATLKVGHVLHRLLCCLCTDFYRPLRVASVHFKLYPDEVYNPMTSPFRVYEAVKRLRTWLEENRVPLGIEESRGSYRLVADKVCAIRIPAGSDLEDKNLPNLEKLRVACSKEPFSVQRACEVLQLPKRTVNRFLKDVSQKGQLVRSGQSRATRYQFPR